MTPYSPDSPLSMDAPRGGDPVSDAAGTGASPVGAWNMSGPLPFRLRGNDVQSIEFALTPGDRLLSEPQAFIIARGGIASIDVSWGQSLLTPLYRIWAGEAAILQQVICRDRPGTVILGAPYIGRIVRLALRPGRGIVCQRGSLMAATGDITISIAFPTRLTAGLFGGLGVVFQRLTGTGDVFLHGLGAVVDWTAARGESVRVGTHHVLAFDESVGYQVRLAGGLRTLLFGGQGFFLSRLEGPGRLVVQSIDRAAFAARLRTVARTVRRDRVTNDPSASRAS